MPARLCVTRSPTPLTSLPEGDHRSPFVVPGLGDGTTRRRGLESVGPPGDLQAHGGREGSTRPGTASIAGPRWTTVSGPRIHPLEPGSGSRAVAPPSQDAPTFSGDHSPIHGRSATIAYNDSGDARISVVTLTSSAMATP